jgi:hypothetical protein
VIEVAACGGKWDEITPILWNYYLIIISEENRDMSVGLLILLHVKEWVSLRRTSLC